MRKYYIATSHGKRALAVARRQIAELVAEIMEEADVPVLSASNKHRVAK